MVGIPYVAPVRILLGSGHCAVQCVHGLLSVPSHRSQRRIACLSTGKIAEFAAYLIAFTMLLVMLWDNPIVLPGKCKYLSFGSDALSKTISSLMPGDPLSQQLHRRCISLLDAYSEMDSQQLARTMLFAVLGLMWLVSSLPKHILGIASRVAQLPSILSFCAGFVFLCSVYPALLFEMIPVFIFLFLWVPYRLLVVPCMWLITQGTRCIRCSWRLARHDETLEMT